MKHTTVHERLLARTAEGAYYKALRVDPGEPPAEAITVRADEAAREALHVGNAPRARSLLDVFAATVVRCPEQIAIDAADATLSYAQLSDAASALAARLSSLGIGPGDRVGVRVASGTAELYVAILGVLSAGAAYVPVDAEDPPGRAEQLWRRSNACAVVQSGLKVTHLAPAGGAERGLTIGDDAWVIFTSGSTGEPKAVAVTHRSAAAFVDAEAQLWSVDVRDRVLAGLSVGFDASCEEIWLAWRHGAALVPAPRELVRSGMDLGTWIAQRSITVVSTVPSLAALWDEDSLSSVRLLILGGEACPEGLGQRLAATREVWNTYGPTEATVVSTAARIRPGEPVTIGRPMKGWEVAVLDSDGAPVALGELGELVIAGVGLGRYLDPALDAKRFAAVRERGWDRAYRTGDIVRESVHGLEFIGRRDDQVKIGGRRVELGEIDAQLTAIAGVKAGLTAVRESAAGNKLLVGYVVAEIDPAEIRAALADRLPEGLAPMIVPLQALPRGRAGKADRRALPWPPPGGSAAPAPEPGTAAWLAERWAEQLGPLTITAESDFFELGGSSLSAAKLVSVLRSRYPAVAVSDIYNHRRLGELAARLDRLHGCGEIGALPTAVDSRRWSLAQLGGVLALFILSSPQWLLGILAVDKLAGTQFGPQLSWGWLIVGWLVFGTAVGRVTLVVIARRVLLPSLKAGRYPRHGWLCCRLWFLERLSEAFRSERLAGTPFAARYARLCGHSVGAGARLGTLPPVTSLLSIGENATLESDVDAHGWWLERDQLVVGELVIGAGARIGARTLLAPGAEVGAGAEIEPGSVISGSVPAGERWAGSPAKRVGRAGEGWPQDAFPRPRAARFWRAMFAVGLGAQALLPLAAAGPGLVLMMSSSIGHGEQGLALTVITRAPVIAASFLFTYAVLVALAVRCVGFLIRPGFHPDEGVVGWALWFSEALMGEARGVLFSLYSSIYTRPWLRLAGIDIGKRAELSTAVNLNRLTKFGEFSFAADDVVLVPARARAGWLHVAPIEVGNGTFLGNGAILDTGTKLGRDCLVGVLTNAPPTTADGTSWFGSPPIELPRVPDRVDASRTTSPPRRLILARGCLELIRILLPVSISVVLAGFVFWALETIAAAVGIALMALAIPVVVIAAGVCATAFTVAAKWLIMGRYRPGEHPLWSFFVWRDEIMNSLQDVLAGTWLMGVATATPLMSLYLRAMGAKVGRDVWCETMTITEFDMVELGDGCVVNRFACVETHLFHDRLMRIGPTRIGPGSSLGPASAVLPDTVIGAGTRIGGRSVVLRGEELPPGTSWHGAPVVAV